MRVRQRPGLELRDSFWVNQDLPRVGEHPESRELFYSRIVIPLVTRFLKFQRVELTVEGSENIPAVGGALLAINHTGYLDFILSGVSAYTRGKRLIRFLAKQEIFQIPVVGRFMQWMKHTPVDRSAGAQALDSAIAALREGDLVGIFPEGTISRSFEVATPLRTGAVRIADGAQVPLLPVAVWGSQRLWTKDLPRDLRRSGIPVWVRVGEPIDPSGDPKQASVRLHAAMQKLVEETRATYEQEYGPFPGGEAWRPQSLGGSAPDPEEAERLTREEKEQRKQRKAEKKRQRQQAWWRKLRSKKS